MYGKNKGAAAPLLKMLHLAIIPDGNRRFGLKNTDDKLKGHRYGMDRIIQIVTWFYLCDTKCDELTLYLFSEENWSRDKKEINSLTLLAYELVDCLITIFSFCTNKIGIKSIYQLYDRFEDCKELYVQFLKSNRSAISPLNVKFCITDFEHIPINLLELIKCANSFFKEDSVVSDKTTKKINLCFSYSGRGDIVNSISKIQEKGEEMTKENIQKNLNINRDIDIMIRSSGEKRLSNFAIWQNSYSEMFFIDKLWPEITYKDIEEIVNEFYAKRDRRFGK